MSIKRYREKEIRKSIINKIKPAISGSKRAKHDKGLIFLNNKVVARVKIPNESKREMNQNKSKYIAQDLQLKCDEFNDLVECYLKGPGYYKILETRV